MPKFNRPRQPFGQQLYELTQTIDVALQVRWELKQNGPEFVRFPQWFNRIEEFCGGFLRGVQPFDVGDGLMRLHRELKIVSSGFIPTIQQRLACQAAEGEVDLYRIEPGRVIPEEFLGGQLLRIKIRFPGRIRPPRCSRVDFSQVSTRPG